MTKREREILEWMHRNTPANGSQAWYTDEIGTSARLLNGLHKRGLVSRHDPNANFYVRAGSAPIRWSLTQPGLNALTAS